MTRSIAEKRLWLPGYWDKITQNQKDTAYNGVGPEFFPSWIRKLLNWVFHWAYWAVFVHDVEYTYSKYKILADLRFLYNCLLYAGLDLIRVAASFVLFFLVLFFGKQAWQASRQN